MKTETTTIKLDKSTVELISRNKILGRETYNDTIVRIFRRYEAAKKFDVLEMEK